MSKRSDYDERQLKLMYENLIFFEKKRINLDSLVGSLEFLLSALELVDDEWEVKFLKEITTLESINAIEIITEEEGGVFDLKNDEKDRMIKSAILNLKCLVDNEINKSECI